MVDLEKLKKAFPITNRWDGEDSKYIYISYDTLLTFPDNEVLYYKFCGSYQGDAVYLLKNKLGEFGFIVIGYGSCSGCDFVEGWNSDYRTDYKELAEVVESYQKDIRWFNTKKELNKWLSKEYAKDGPNRWYSHDNEIVATIKEIQALEV